MMKKLLLFWTHWNEIGLSRSLEKVNEKLRDYYDHLFVNEEAIKQWVRYLEYDMNRVKPDIKSQEYECFRKAEIIEQAKTYECTIDIHGTDSDCWIVTIITKATIANIYWALFFPADAHVIRQSMSSSTEWPITQFLKKWFEVEVWEMNKKESYDRLWECLNIYLSWPEHYSVKNLYIVTHKLTGTPYTKDFLEVIHDWEKYYTFLTRNTYNDISCYLMKKIRLEDLLCDIPERINVSTKTI